MAIAGFSATILYEPRVYLVGGLFIGLILGACISVAIETYFKIKCPNCNVLGLREYYEEKHGPVFHQCDTCRTIYKRYEKMDHDNDI